MKFPSKGYRQLYSECPEIPENTCPHIDIAQQHLEEIKVDVEQYVDIAQHRLEELRDQNEALRDVGKYWREVSMNLLQECCKLNNHIKKLEEE
tara:strand:+ start:705 stop:983 length:279 start_codon:yes stop_codon:yes gene_type:complete